MCTDNSYALTDIDVDYFISLIEERPVLWDKTIVEYKDKISKTEAWKSVGRCLCPNFDELNNATITKLVNDLVKKWRGYKDNFSKYERKVKELAKTGSSSKFKQYHLYNQLLFLKKNETVVEDEELGSRTSRRQETQRKILLHTQPAPRKRKVDEFDDSILKVLREPENRHMSFFKGILPSVEKLNDDQTLIFQSRVLQILTDLQKPALFSLNQTNEQTNFGISFSDGCHTSETSPQNTDPTSWPLIQNTSNKRHHTLDSETNEDSLTNISSETIDIKTFKVSFSDSETELTNSN